MSNYLYQDSRGTPQCRHDRHDDAQKQWDENRAYEDRYGEMTPEEIALAVAQMRRERLEKTNPITFKHD